MGSFLDFVDDVLDRYATGVASLSREEAHAYYDELAADVPMGTLALTIGPALGSLGQQQVYERVRDTTAAMDVRQRGRFVQTLLDGLREVGGGLSSLLPRLAIDPRIEIDPGHADAAEVATLATHAQQTKPAVFDQAMALLAGCPSLVKALGPLVIARIGRKLFRRPARLDL